MSPYRKPDPTEATLEARRLAALEHAKVVDLQLKLQRAEEERGHAIWRAKVAGASLRDLASDLHVSVESIRKWGGIAPSVEDSMDVMSESIRQLNDALRRGSRPAEP